MTNQCQSYIHSIPRVDKLTNLGLPRRSTVVSPSLEVQLCNDVFE